MKIYTVTTVDELISVADKFAGARKCLWRCHADSKWKLESSIKRYFDSKNINIMRKGMTWRKTVLQHILA